MVDKEKIWEQLYRFFYVDQIHNIDITDDGVVNTNSGLQFRADEPLPDGVLPFQFGVVGGNLRLANAGLVSLQGMPTEIKGMLSLSKNPLKNLVGCTQKIGEYLRLRQMPELESLEGFPTQLAEYVALDWKPNLPLLRTLQAPGGAVLWPSNVETDEIEYILEKYKGQGRAGAIDCKRELVEAGYEGNARW